MIRKCRVILHNEFVMVVDFGGVLVQMPSTKSCGQSLYIEQKNGKYFVSNEKEYLKSLEATPRKAKKEKEIDA